MIYQFNVETFLKLPTDIRKHVYYHLNGSLISIKPDAYEEVEFLTKRQKRRRKVLYNFMYPVFKPYLKNFKYDSEFIYKWLELALWFRYDSIVLDCLRLNQLYEGTLLGPIDIITLDGHLQFAFFDKEQSFLQVWYSKRDYQNMIMNQYFAYDKYKPETDCNFIRLNLEILSKSMVTATLANLLKKQYLLFINHIEFAEESAHRQQSSYYDDDNAFDYDDSDEEDNNLIKNNNSKGRKRRISDYNTKNNKKGKILISSHIQMIVNNIKSMRNIQVISCHGNNLFKHLIDGNAFSNRNLKSIPSVVKKKIPTLQLYQINNITRSNIVDVSMWESLKTIVLSNIDKVDLNMLILPHSCISLTIKHVKVCKWWDFESRINRLCGGKFKTVELKKDKNSSEDSRISKLELVDESSMAPELIFDCQKLFWKNLPEITEIIFYNVSIFSPDHMIILPRTLYLNQRIRFYNCGQIDGMLLL